MLAALKARLLTSYVSVVVLALALLRGLPIDPHEAMHSGTVVMTLFLFFISLLTYYRTRSRRLLYVSSAFFFYCVREVILFLNLVLATTADISIPLIQVEASHFLSFVTLALFSVGVVRE